jgi:hypothetical protein
VIGILSTVAVANVVKSDVKTVLIFVMIVQMRVIHLMNIVTTVVRKKFKWYIVAIMLGPTVKNIAKKMKINVGNVMRIVAMPNDIEILKNLFF